MGQKTHPFFFRACLDGSDWNSKYIEKTSEESALLLYKDLNIRSYMDRIFSLFGLILVECRIEYSVSKIQVFVSFYDRFNYFIDKNNFKSVIFGVNKKLKVSRKKLVTKLINNVIFVTIIKYQINKKLIVDNIIVDLNIKNLNKKFENCILKNKNSELEYKKIVRRLRINLEYKELLKIAFIVISEKNSAILLSTIISIYIKKFQKQKKHNFLFLSLKKIFEVLITSKLSKINGLKISVSGRFNGFLRAKTKIFSVGNVPLQSFSSFIDYHHATSYTVHGTFGIKVWIYEK